MADISMCSGEGCPRKNRCYRHTATPDQYMQTWLCDPPFDSVTGQCDMYWKRKGADDESDKDMHQVRQDDAPHR